MANLSAGQDASPLHETVVERTDGAEHVFANPHQTCVNLWESTKDDWPGYTMTVLLNERARFLMTKARMESMLGGKYTVQEYLEMSA
ncbi:hypothetical protein [Tessaracoccus sp.]